MTSNSPDSDDREIDSEDRFYFVRKHNIPIPVFRAFLQVFAEKYRGKFRKERGRVEKFHKPVDSDSED